MDEESVVGHEPHISEFILVFGDGCAVYSYTFASLWCALKLEEAYVYVLGPGFD